ncbi:MAG: ATP-binding cassette domain-containing protein [Alphaproteobacteria bacterium]|nr:ATP-binding cassette domain-containing protein [Alphaproteobacteria bacterium]
MTIDAAGVEKRRGGLIVTIERLLLGAGERAALIGPSGCGKSTSLDLLAAILRPDRADRLMVAGADLVALWAAGAGGMTAWRGRQVGYVLQTGGLLPFLSVAENIRLGRRLLGLAGWGPARDIAAVLGLEPLLDRHPAQLSVGERQRVAVARALAHEPRLVLADEPTAALDPARAAETMALLNGLAARQDTTLLVVTHDAELAEASGLRLIRAETGDGITRIAWDGTA